MANTDNLDTPTCADGRTKIHFCIYSNIDGGVYLWSQHCEITPTDDSNVVRGVNYSHADPISPADHYEAIHKIATYTSTAHSIMSLTLILSLVS